VQAVKAEEVLRDVAEKGGRATRVGREAQAQAVHDQAALLRLLPRAEGKDVGEGPNDA